MTSDSGGQTDLPTPEEGEADVILRGTKPIELLLVLEMVHLGLHLGHTRFSVLSSWRFSADTALAIPLYFKQL